MAGDDQRGQFDGCVAGQFGGAVVRRAERVVDFDVANERGAADLVGVEEGVGSDVERCEGRDSFSTVESCR